MLINLGVRYQSGNGSLYCNPTNVYDAVTIANASQMSPIPFNEKEIRRESVILKVGSCHVFPAEDINNDINRCRWEHCFR